MFIEEMGPERINYMTRWVSNTRSEVNAHKLIHGERKEIGCVFVGTAEDCRKYIGRKIGGLQLSCNKLYNTKGVGH